MATDVRSGVLLVAAPALADPNFALTVVLVLEHGETGTVGVVLNRPSGVTVPSLLPALDPLAADPPVVFAGGPVQRDGVLGLASAHTAATSVRPVLPGVGVVDLDADPAVLSAEVSRLRLFAGYAGWEADQLDAELAVGGWFVVEASAEDVFTTDPDSLWSAVLRRQGGMFTTISEDPTQN